MEEQWEISALEHLLAGEFQLELPLAAWLAADNSLDGQQLTQKIVMAAHQAYADKSMTIGEESIRHFERGVMLQALDTHWREHLAALDHLRQGIHLRGYAQKNPKQEYKREAFELFSAMLDSIKLEVTRILLTVQVRSPEDYAALENAQEGEALSGLAYQHPALDDDDEDDVPLASTAHEEMAKVGRNDPCPCGSGKKYKHCHGRLA